MPLGKVVVNAIVPSAPAQVVGLVAKPAVSVGAVGSVKVLVSDDVPVQPPVVTENPEKVPSGKPVKVNAPLVTVTVFGLPEPV